MKRLLAIALSLVLLLGLAPVTTAAGGGVLRYYVNPVPHTVNPLNTTFTVDQTAASLVYSPFLASDRGGAVISHGIEGETITYGGKDYTYYGIGDLQVRENDDGSADYLLTMRRNLKFSDGQSANIDDLIFTMYLLCDPSYTGSNTFNSLPILGVEEYAQGYITVGYEIALDGPEGVSDYYTPQQRDAFWAAVDRASADFVNGIVSFCEPYGATNISEAMGLWGFELPGNATVEDAWDALMEDYNGDIVSINTIEKGDVDLFSAMRQYLGDDADFYFAGTKVGESADSIPGIERTGDYSLTVHCTTLASVTAYSLSVPIVPLHAYGDPSLFRYGENSFGFKKGSAMNVIEGIDGTVGSGPFTVSDRNNAQLILKANPYYYLGAPKIEQFVFELRNTDAVSGILEGRCDVSDPGFSESIAAAIRQANSNGELSGDKITTAVTDNLGYGYIGLNADMVCVDSNPSSAASKALRKGLATVLAAHRESAIRDYYGDCAEVINYPISSTSWASPQPGDEGYEVAYSKDVDGNPIYAPGMSQTQRYAAALNAAVGFFKAAGYTWDDALGMFTAAPEGASLTYTAFIPGGGYGDQPCYGIVSEAALELQTIGIDLRIYDPEDSEILWDILDTGTQMIWAAAWASAVDPDMYQVYHSSNIIGRNGTDSNHYHIADRMLDRLIVTARSTSDFNSRKALYRECMDIILDWGVEVPVYQRQNATVFSTERIKVSTLPEDMTPFYGWLSEIQNLELTDGAAAGFVDVPGGEYYAKPVAWAVERGITNGTDSTHFSPDDTCTRGQVVTFLWRAAGKPQPQSSENPFLDVSPNDYFYDAVLWAVEKGVTNGTDPGRFSPEEKCTRGQVVTFQWRAAGKPDVTASGNPFSDVSSGDYFYTAVLWAVGQKVTTGTDSTHFSPDESCTRGQVVTFLFRADH